MPAVDQIRWVGANGREVSELARRATVPLLHPWWWLSPELALDQRERRPTGQSHITLRSLPNASCAIKRFGMTLERAVVVR